MGQCGRVTAHDTKEGAKKRQTRSESITGSSRSSRQLFLLINHARLCHTCANDGRLAGGGGAPHRLHHQQHVLDTFEVGSDASVVARCASHQFVQKVRWRGRFGRPAGGLHLLTERRPASDRTTWLHVLLSYSQFNISSQLEMGQI